jgi:hypothetical protein
LRHSDVGDFSSKYAVDGVKDVSCRTGVASCAHLNSKTNQWWRVDFQVGNNIQNRAINSLNGEHNKQEEPNSSHIRLMRHHKSTQEISHHQVLFS